MATLPPAEYADTIIAALAAPILNPAHLISLLCLFPPSPVAPPPIYLALRSSNPERVVPELRKCKGYLKTPWEEIAAGRVKALLHLGKGGEARQRADVQMEKEELHRAYENYETVVTAYLRFLTALPPTTSSRPYLPVLMQLLLDLRQLAVLADRVSATSAASTSTTTAPPQPHLESTARQLNKAFTACVADRNTDMQTSRKWATYRIVVLLFRTYFKLKSLPLCRNILRALSAAPLPALDEYPRADRVSFRYYTGVLHFLAQEYPRAHTDLLYAWENCHVGAVKQQEMILRTLLPLQLLLKGRLPRRSGQSQQPPGNLPQNGQSASPGLLDRFPRMSALYTPFLTSLSPRPCLSRFSQSLQDPTLERALVLQGSYLAVEAIRPILLREVLRRAWLVKKRETRMSLDDAQRALRFAGWAPETPVSGDDDSGAGDAGAKEEVEWLVGGLIARGFVKGYISHERGMIVLSNTNAFPPLRDVGMGATLL